MLTVHTDDIQVVYECQPLLQEPVEFPLPGSLDSVVNTEEDDNAPRE